MRHILDLSFYPPEEGRWLNSHAKFHGIARSKALDIRWICLKPGQKIPDGLIEREIESASGFILRTPHYLSHYTTGIELVRTRMSIGVPLICFLNRNYLAEQNSFLAEFGIQGTRLGLFAHGPQASASHARDVVISRSEYPGAFRDLTLFRGVERMDLDATHAIDVRGEAFSLLAIPGSHALCVDTRTDLFADWPSPEFTCIAGFFGRGDDRRRVLALNTYPLWDPFDDGFGARHRGISGGNNEVFAENLLDWIGDARVDVLPTDISAAHRQLDQLERNYYDVTAGTLKTLSPDWWQVVPERIRESCARKRASEPRSPFPDSAYLELLDYKAIWKAHWEYFAPVLANAGVTGGKGKALHYFHELNEIRKLVMHPTKSQSAGICITREQASYLAGQSQTSIQMWNTIRKLGIAE